MRNLAAVKLKANSHYTCQECGSTELIQAHHEIPHDDNTLAILCAECHSKRHPSVPKALFFTKSLQPYWHNKSASSIARELGIHPRTVIRTAKKLCIQAGELTPLAEASIKENIPKMGWGKPKPKKPKKIGQRQLVREGRAPITEFTVLTDAFLTITETAHALGESTLNINRWITANKLIAVTFGGILFIPKSEVERLKLNKV